jgi:hypothetical protein
METMDNFKGQRVAYHAAVRAIEAKVKQLDEWADKAAADGDYSGAGSNQKAAVDLHCAVAIIKDGIFPHYCGMRDFNRMAGDECPGCQFDEAEHPNG